MSLQTGGPRPVGNQPRTGIGGHEAGGRAPVAPGALSGGYRPHLDGLRAVAVYLVVLFHAGSDRFAGGFVGVDVFFVLSGFLVTQLLLRDLVPSGSIRLRRFYARRFRRLLPAAFVTLVVTALVFGALASPVEVVDAEGGFKAAFLYSTNWYFIDQSADYFGADLATNPVLHFWSLAVEEQFYLLWPLLLGGLFGLARRFRARQWQVLRAVVALAALASLLWAWSLRSTDPTRAYYGTDTRAYQLMGGALLALTPGLMADLGRFARSARLAGPAAIAALVVVASSWVDLDPIERGVAVTAITMMAIVALETAGGGLLHRALSAEPVVYLGKISYGTYLWHWPVLLMLREVLDGSPRPATSAEPLGRQHPVVRREPHRRARGGLVEDRPAAVGQPVQRGPLGDRPAQQHRHRVADRRAVGDRHGEVAGAE
jgi:peptidoglycan/LPS O-acetylase OafA/YrhL